MSYLSFSDFPCDDKNRKTVGHLSVFPICFQSLQHNQHIQLINSEVVETNSSHRRIKNIYRSLRKLVRLPTLLTTAGLALADVLYHDGELDPDKFLFENDRLVKYVRHRIEKIRKV
jgi:hypothetical protein